MDGSVLFDRIETGKYLYFEGKGATFFCVPILCPRVWRLTVDVNKNQEVK